MKRSYLANAGLAMPENADFANIDLEHETLGDGLLRHHVFKDQPTLSSLAQRTASLGEPCLSYFEPDVLEAKLHGIGFSRVEILSPAEAEAQYFRQRPPDLPKPKRTNILSAVV